MGVYFRRLFKLMPGIRLNSSGRSMSVSLGGKGFYHIFGSKGFGTTASSPAYRQSLPSIAAIESQSAEEINALSTSELVPILNGMRGRIRLLWLTGAIVAVVILLTLRSSDPRIIQIGLFYAAFFTAACAVLDRYRRSLRIEYQPEGLAQTIEVAFKQAFDQLKSCAKIWNVSAQGQTHDWKRNAGATSLNRRKEFRPAFDRPNGVRGHVGFPTLKIKGKHLHFLPDAVLVAEEHAVAALSYQDIEFSNQVIRFVEEDAVPSDAIAVGETWRFPNKNGGPDRRFLENRRLPICIYGEMEFRSAGGLNCLIQYSNATAGDSFAKVIGVLAQVGSRIDSNGIRNVVVPKAWVTFAFFAVFLSCSSVLGFSALHFKAPIPLASPKNITWNEIPKSVPTVQYNPPLDMVSPVQPPPNLPMDLLPRPKPKQEAKSRDIPRSVRTGSANGGSVEQCIKIENIDDRVDCLEQLQPPVR